MVWEEGGSIGYEHERMQNLWSWLDFQVREEANKTSSVIVLKSDPSR